MFIAASPGASAHGRPSAAVLWGRSSIWFTPLSSSSAQRRSVKFDPSHTYYRGEDQYAVLRDYVSRLKHFHAKGTNMIGGRRYDDPPAGLDDQNWRKIFGILYAGKYNGGITLEPHSGRWSDELGEWGKEFSINYLKQFIFDN